MKRNRRDYGASIPEQAADWLLELAEPVPSEVSRLQFMSWLKRSPQHVEEFLAIAALHQEVVEQSSTVAEIVASLDHRSAVPLFGESQVRNSAEPLTPRRRHYLAWVLAAGVAVAAFVLVRDVEPPLVTHRTELGEQRSIALSDGSIVMLNTLSEVTVSMDDSTRAVTLVAGEAMFDVVSDPRRPFVVETDAMSLNVVGTKFSVYRKKSSTRVAVVDGVVHAYSSRSPEEPVIVRAGEGAVATAQGVVLTDAHFDIGKAIAWTDRRLVFDGAPLAEVVAEFNRYNRKPLVVEDSTLANRAITTVFNAHDVRALVAFLELEPDVEVERGDDAIRIRVRR
ncbi:MAG: FecR family protein [Woeseiaceae bacterium]